MTKDRFSCLHGTAAISLVLMLMAAPAHSGGTRHCQPDNHWNENIRDMDRIQQASLINQVGVLTSDWYRRALSPGNSPQGDALTPYPAEMTALDIASADIHRNRDGGIRMCVALNARVSGKPQRLEETFVFGTGSSAIHIVGVDRQVPWVTLDNPNQVISTGADGYTARLAAYLWLAQLNRIEITGAVPQLTLSGDSAHLVSGVQRQLGDSGWMIREIRHSKQPDGKMTVEVSVEWKGLRPDGRYTLQPFATP